MNSYMKLQPSIPFAALRASIAALVLFCANGAAASQLVFQGQNAGLFPGANPSDTSTLMNSVPKPNKGSAASAAAASGVSAATLIEQAIESQISNKIINDIFNTSNASGSFNLGNGTTISFLRTGGNIDITIVDPVHGTTEIVIPDI
jgi:Type VIII secretion system (T8SS), CsgF protein